ncbi:flagellar hook-length control protein FliK [Pseudooctadecabacter jejudonensis]
MVDGQKSADFLAAWEESHPNPEGPVVEINDVETETETPETNAVATEGDETKQVISHELETPVAGTLAAVSPEQVAPMPKRSLAGEIGGQDTSDEGLIAPEEPQLSDKKSSTSPLLQGEGPVMRVSADGRVESKLDNTVGPVPSDGVISEPLEGGTSAFTSLNARTAEAAPSTPPAERPQEGAAPSNTRTTEVASMINPKASLPNGKSGETSERTLDGIAPAPRAETLSAAPQPPNANVVFSTLSPPQPSGLTSLAGFEHLVRPLPTVTDEPFAETEMSELFVADVGLASTSSSPMAAPQNASAMMPVMRQHAGFVAQQLAAALTQAQGAATQITLNPEELGTVRLSLSAGEAGIVVNIVAERPETADLMRRNIDSLLQEFADMGYDNPSFSFDGSNQDDHPPEERLPSPAGPQISPDVSIPQPLRQPGGGLDLKL